MCAPAVPGDGQWCLLPPASPSVCPHGLPSIVLVVVQHNTCFQGSCRPTGRGGGSEPPGGLSAPCLSANSPPKSHKHLKCPDEASHARRDLQGVPFHPASASASVEITLLCPVWKCHCLRASDPHPDESVSPQVSREESTVTRWLCVAVVHNTVSRVSLDVTVLCWGRCPTGTVVASVIRKHSQAPWAARPSSITGRNIFCEFASVEVHRAGEADPLRLPCLGKRGLLQSARDDALPPVSPQIPSGNLGMFGSSGAAQARTMQQPPQPPAQPLSSSQPSLRTQVPPFLSPQVGPAARAPSGATHAALLWRLGHGHVTAVE